MTTTKNDFIKGAAVRELILTDFDGDTLRLEHDEDCVDGVDLTVTEGGSSSAVALEWDDVVALFEALGVLIIEADSKGYLGE